MLDLVSSPHPPPDEKDNNNDYRYCQYKISSMVIRWKAQVLVVSRMMRGGGAGTNEGDMGEERLTLVNFNEAQLVIKGVFLSS